MSVCGTSRKSAKKAEKSVPLSWPGFSTVTSFNVPGGSAGVVAVAVVSEAMSTSVAATPPTSIVALGSKPEPVRESSVFPSAGPEVGVIESSEGAPGKPTVRTPEALVTICPSGLVTVIVRGPFGAPTVLRSSVMDVGPLYVTALTATPSETEAWSRFGNPAPGSKNPEPPDGVAVTSTRTEETPESTSGGSAEVGGAGGGATSCATRTP